MRQRFPFPAFLKGGLALGSALLLAALMGCHSTSNDEDRYQAPAPPLPKIASGDGHSLVVRSDGTVWAWGLNNRGQLGDGSTFDRSAPVRATGLDHVVAISGGGGMPWLPAEPLACVRGHSVALKEDGTVWAWGYNYLGQIGDGTITDRSNPVQVSGLFNVASLSAGPFHNLALKRDGTVWAWGANEDGQLGEGSGEMIRTVPVQVPNLSGIVAVAGCSASYEGDSYSLALKNDGTVWAWGFNESGELGDGTTTIRSTPVQVQGISEVVALASQWGRSLALRRDGTVWRWGYAGYQINPILRPSKVESLSGIKAISGLLALKTDGNLLGWSFDEQGRMTTPASIPNLSGITAIATGDSLTNLALKSDGSLWSWGSNEWGELGDGQPTVVATPQEVASGFQSAVAGGNCTLASKGDGSLWSWGWNWVFSASQWPGPSTPASFASISEVASYSSSSSHTLVRKSDGTAWAWGYNGYSQLGNGGTTDSPAPVQVTGLTSITAVQTANLRSFALKSDGSVWAWGNNVGLLGDGTSTDQWSPVQLTSLSGITALAAGKATHVLALKNDGSVWAWGRNTWGELGDGSTTTRSAPVQVQGLSNIIAIAAGANHSLTLRNDGTVWAWGSNAFGQLGDGTRISQLSPIQVTGLAGVTAISAGRCHSLAITPGGLKAWGADYDGQLGLGRLLSRTSPAQVHFAP